jgi:5-methylcytosine-specific restriction endonuclease McrA
VPRAARRQAMQRDGNRCVECGSTQDLQVHHIVPRREGGSHELSNLITLCAACHERLDMASNAPQFAHRSPGSSRPDATLPDVTRS